MKARMHSAVGILLTNLIRENKSGQEWSMTDTHLMLTKFVTKHNPKCMSRTQLFSPIRFINKMPASAFWLSKIRV